MVLADLNEIIGAGICEKVYPFFWVPRICGEVLNKIIVDEFRSIGLFLIVVYISRIAGALTKPPPIPRNRQSWCIFVLSLNAYHSA